MEQICHPRPQQDGSAINQKLHTFPHGTLWSLNKVLREVNSSRQTFFWLLLTDSERKNNGDSIYIALNGSVTEIKMAAWLGCSLSLLWYDRTKGELLRMSPQGSAPSKPCFRSSLCVWQLHRVPTLQPERITRVLQHRPETCWHQTVGKVLTRPAHIQPGPGPGY